METCEYCSFFGVKKHCYNCKIKNISDKRRPVRNPMPFNSFLEFVKSHSAEEISEQFVPGDSFDTKLLTGEDILVYIAGIECDESVNGEKAKVTLCCVGIPYMFPLDYKKNANHGEYPETYFDTTMHSVTLPGIVKILPSNFRKSIVAVEKSVHNPNSGEFVKNICSAWLFSEAETSALRVSVSSDEGERYPLFQENIAPTISGYCPLRTKKNHLSFVSYRDPKNISYTNFYHFHYMIFGVCI